MDLEFVLNGRSISVLNVEGHETLLSVLRDSSDLEKPVSKKNKVIYSKCFILLFLIRNE